MKVYAEIKQIQSDVDSGFFNIEDFDGVAIGVWGLEGSSYLFKEIGRKSAVCYQIVSTFDIEGFLSYIKEKKPEFLENYKLVGSLREVGLCKEGGNE
jgi:hypothetical protein